MTAATPRPGEAVAPAKAPAGTAPNPGAPGGSQHRAEIHGLRGLGILLVFAYHLWGAGRVSGGVDIFLMISAYLMTASFVRKGLSFSLPGFLINRFRRLIPLATVVILTVLVVGSMVLAPMFRPELLRHARSSFLYSENWELIADSVNYTSNSEASASPFQHFWSMSVQGQVFVIWPLLFMVVLGLHRVTKISIRTMVGFAFAAITIVSFLRALQMLNQTPAVAYFDTSARLWEFSLASLLATIPFPKEPPRLLGQVLGWGGLAGVLASGFLVGRTSFPGWTALVPLLSAAAVILAGPRAAPGTAAHLLSRPPLVWIADRAYGLYLWHWPVLVFVLAISGAPSVGVLESLVTIAIAFALADLSTRLIERRFQRLAIFKAKRFGLVLIAACLIVVLGTINGITRMVDSSEDRIQAETELNRPGAKQVTPGVPVPSATATRSIAPGDVRIAQDWPPNFPLCAPLEPAVPDMANCMEITPQTEPAAKRVVLIGDSHSYQWSTALEPLAKKENWHLQMINRPACRVSAISGEHGDEACAAYSKQVVEWIVANKPDYVINVGTRAQADGPEQPVDGYLEAIQPVLDSGITVVNLRDTPRFSFKMPACVQNNGTSSPKCLKPRSEKIGNDQAMADLAAHPGMRTMDLTNWICPDGMCPGVIGNVYVYMDDNHLSRTYVNSLVDEFEAQWRAATA